MGLFSFLFGGKRNKEDPASEPQGQPESAATSADPSEEVLDATMLLPNLQKNDDSQPQEKDDLMEAISIAVMQKTDPFGKEAFSDMVPVSTAAFDDTTYRSSDEEQVTDEMPVIEDSVTDELPATPIDTEAGEAVVNDTEDDLTDVDKISEDDETIEADDEEVKEDDVEIVEADAEDVEDADEEVIEANDEEVEEDDDEIEEAEAEDVEDADEEVIEADDEEVKEDDVEIVEADAEDVEDADEEVIEADAEEVEEDDDEIEEAEAEDVEDADEEVIEADDEEVEEDDDEIEEAEAEDAEEAEDDNRGDDEEDSVCLEPATEIQTNTISPAVMAVIEQIRPSDSTRAEEEPAEPIHWESPWGAHMTSKEYESDSTIPSFDDEGFRLVWKLKGTGKKRRLRAIKECVKGQPVFVICNSNGSNCTIITEDGEELGRLNEQDSAIYHNLVVGNPHHLYIKKLRLSEYKKPVVKILVIVRQSDEK